jgi:putative methanogenesis marker protein 8
MEKGIVRSAKPIRHSFYEQEENCGSMARKDKHVMEALGMTKVVIEDGKVTFVGEPQVRYCPLFAKHRGIKEFTPEAVRGNIEFRIKDFGMCTPARQMRMKDFLSFGVSELIAMCITRKMLDCAVLVTDGAGTVIVTDPEIVQGIGGRISGIVETSPIDEVIDAVGRKNVLDPETARIDQLAGAQMAFQQGHKNVAVTIAKARDAKKIRDAYGNKVALFAVHISGTSEKDTNTLFDCCDIVSGCASGWVRAEAKKRSVLQAGNKVPVYAVSEFGKMILEERLKQIGYKPETGPEETPLPLL